MDSLFFHPKIVHIPMALAVLMPIISFGLVLAWWRGWLPPRTWVFAVALQGILVVTGIIALRTGETDEERVEEVVAEQHIEAHEEAAELFVWSSALVLPIMMAGLAFSRRKAGQVLALVASLGTVAVGAIGYRTGQAGGELVYEHGAASVHHQNQPPSPTAHENEHD